MTNSADLKITAQWEEVFRTMTRAKYPSEEMIRFIQRTFGELPMEKRNALKVLDLGCGNGTSSWYLSREGFSVEGIDGSETAVERCRQWLAHEKLDGTFTVGLMQTLPYADNSFDVIVDNGSSTSVPMPTLQTIVSEIKRVLKPGGHYYGMYLGKETTIEGVQAESTDAEFYTDITGGPIQRAATVRLVDDAELSSLYQPVLSTLDIDYNLRTLCNRKEQVQTWIVTGQAK